MKNYTLKEKLHNALKYAKNRKERKAAAKNIVEYSNTIPNKTLVEVTSEIIETKTKDNDSINFLSV